MRLSKTVYVCVCGVGIQFKTGDLCLVIHVVEILSLILRDQVNKCSEGLTIVLNSPYLPVPCWVNIYKVTGLGLRWSFAGVMMGLVSPAGLVSSKEAPEIWQKLKVTQRVNGGAGLMSGLLIAAAAYEASSLCFDVLGSYYHNNAV